MGSKHEPYIDLVFIQLKNESSLITHNSSHNPHLAVTLYAEPHSSVSSGADLRTGGRWFDPRLGHYSFRGLMIVIATGLILLSLIAVRCFDNGNVGKQPVAWKEYCTGSKNSRKDG